MCVFEDLHDSVYPREIFSNLCLYRYIYMEQNYKITKIFQTWDTSAKLNDFSMLLGPLETILLVTVRREIILTSDASCWNTGVMK